MRRPRGRSLGVANSGLKPSPSVGFSALKRESKNAGNPAKYPAKKSLKKIKKISKKPLTDRAAWSIIETVKGQPKQLPTCSKSGQRVPKRS